jgi:hypothetical protein
MLVVVKMQDSPVRGKVWRVCVFIDGNRLIRPGFQKRKPAIKLAAMMVQQGLIHGWNVSWRVLNESGVTENVNLASLGSKMNRGEKKDANSG